MLIYLFAQGVDSLLINMHFHCHANYVICCVVDKLAQHLACFEFNHLAIPIANSDVIVTPMSC